MVNNMDLLQRLVGCECWHCFLLPDSSVLSLAIGEKLPNPSKRAAQHRPGDPRRFRPEFGLWIECAWRLDSDRAVITVWSDKGPAPNGPLAKGIEQLYGRKVTAVETCPPAWDLVVKFEGGYLLKVFVDTSEATDSQDAWALFERDEILLSVGPKGRWSTDPNRPSNTW